MFPEHNLPMLNYCIQHFLRFRIVPLRLKRQDAFPKMVSKRLLDMFFTLRWIYRELPERGSSPSPVTMPSFPENSSFKGQFEWKGSNKRSSRSIKALLRHFILKEPLSYILGTQFFINYYFRVKKPILIPREDTQIWLDKLLRDLERQWLRDSIGQPPRPSITFDILDVCSGSGCLGLSTLDYLQKLQRKKGLFVDLSLTNVDISPVAMKLLQENHQRIQTYLQGKFNYGLPPVYNYICDLFKSTGTEGSLPWLDKRYDLILCNPPYIPPRYKYQLPHSVTQWEAHEAILTRTKEGLEFYILILEKLQKTLKISGMAVFEVNDVEQLNAVDKLAQNYGFYTEKYPNKGFIPSIRITLESKPALECKLDGS